MQFFRVEPAAVYQLSAGFHSASLAAADDAASLRSAARLPAAAFGRLPQGVAASARYERKLEEALEGLAALEATLQQVAANLRSSADAYMMADQANLLG
jgi:hypothetical protein